MIISASRRTDIPAFYADWLIGRIRAGLCEVPNPFNPHQVSKVSLKPEEVDWIVFWTRNPRPLFRYLDELDERGFGYYFQLTMLDYPALIDAYSPRVERSLGTFRSLSERVGPERVIWRYDPIVLSEITPVDFHLKTFNRLAATLQGFTQRVVVSYLDIYDKARRRLEAMQKQGAGLLPHPHPNLEKGEDLPNDLRVLSVQLSQIASENGMEIQSCAEELDLEPYGIPAGKCIDGGLIERLCGRPLTDQKDPGQRKACGCVVSKDIGMYDSCLFGCRYCYATRSFEQARRNYESHDSRDASIYRLDYHK